MSKEKVAPRRGWALALATAAVGLGSALVVLLGVAGLAGCPLSFAFGALLRMPMALLVPPGMAALSALALLVLPRAERKTSVFARAAWLVLAVRVAEFGAAVGLHDSVLGVPFLFVGVPSPDQIIVDGMVIGLGAVGSFRGGGWRGFVSGVGAVLAGGAFLYADVRLVWSVKWWAYGIPWH